MKPGLIIELGLCCAIMATAGCACLERAFLFYEPLPTTRKLGDLSDSEFHADLVWPNAEPGGLLLLAGISCVSSNYPIERKCPRFEGVITVTVKGETEPMREVAISSANAAHCNWLWPDLDSFLLTSGIVDQLGVFEPGREYQIELIFAEAPVEFESIWISYFQSEKQRRQEEERTRRATLPR